MNMIGWNSGYKMCARKNNHDRVMPGKISLGYSLHSLH